MSLLRAENTIGAVVKRPGALTAKLSTEDTFDRGPAVVSCEEKERLLVAQNKAFSTYRRMLAQLADVAGMAAHADEALANRVRAAKEFLLQTRQQFDEHTAKHGC